jgi:hypothetical protein
MLERLAERVNANAALVRRGQFLTTRFLVEAGAAGWIVRIEKGRVAAVEPNSFAASDWAFALRAPEAAWTAFFQPRPRPGFHDLMALIKGRHLKLEGDLQTFMTNLRYFKEALGALRAGEAGP